MSNRICCLTLSAMLFALCASAEAQQARNIPRIGLLLTNSSSSESTRVEGFRQGLRERGYVEGQNIVIEYRYGDGKLDRLPQFAAELVQLKVDVIVTSGTPPTRAAQQATKTIPIVMTVVGDPIEAGFVTSLAKPGGNITGVDANVTTAKRKKARAVEGDVSQDFPCGSGR